METFNGITCLVYIVLSTNVVILPNAQEFRDSNANVERVSEVSIPPGALIVDLSYNKITRLYDGDFATLSQLQTLYLVGNQITTIDTGAFQGLTALQKLLLQNNKITQFPDLSEQEQLTELYLQNNDISSLPENVLLPTNNSVQRLDLSGNKFSVVPTNFLRVFKALQHLNLCCGNLQAVPPVYELATSLQILDVRSSQISAVESQSFTDGNTVSSLTTLILEDNTLTVEGGVFQSLPNLQVLNLNKVGLTELPNLAASINLRELYISNNSITSLSRERLLANHPVYSNKLTLSTLNAANNMIGSIDGAMLSSYTNLRRLDLGSNKLTSFPLRSLAGALTLQYLNLESNQLETLPDWGVSNRNGLKIDITDNPLDCSTICWFVQSRYVEYNPDRLRNVTTPTACAKPTDMAQFSWEEITSKPKLICGAEQTTATTKSPGDKTKDGEEGSSNKLEIIIGISISVFVVAGIIAVVSVLKFCVWGKRDPDVILIGKMESGLSQKKKGESLANGTKSKEDGDSLRREPRDKRHSDNRRDSNKRRDRHSRHSRSPRNSRLQTISEKSENMDNSPENQKSSSRRSEENRDRTADRTNDRRGHSNKRSDREKNKKPMRSNTSNSDPTSSTEIPFEFTYRV